jgi:iron complex outermembrane receptor protein
MRQKKRTAAALLVSTSAVLAGTSAAQTEDAGARLEEVTVTARKREENLQDVPTSITAVSADALQKAGIVRLESMAAVVPNFFYSETVAFNDQISIRGIGSGVNPGFENSVGQQIDGVFFGRSRFGRAAFLDVQQVEVLKGPQGPLIGKNTTAGAINIRTARPTAELGGYLSATANLESDKGQIIEAALSGPLGDSVRGRVAARFTNTDGYYFNNPRQRDEMQRDDYTVRGSLDVDLSDAVTASLMYQHGKDERTGRNRELVTCRADELAILLRVGEDCVFDYRSGFNNLRNGALADESTDSDFDIAALTLRWDLGAIGEITSVTGYASYDAADEFDGDGSAIEAVSFSLGEKYSQISEELRIASNSGGAVEWLAGVYYLKTEQETRLSIGFNQQGPVPLFPVLPANSRVTSNRDTDQDSTTRAAFGQLTWNGPGNWSVTGGLRYTKERKSALNQEFPTILYTETPVTVQPVAGPGRFTHTFAATINESQLTPNLSVQWRPRPGTMLYAKADKGFKGGGFDQAITGAQSVASAFVFRPEEALSLELGGKFSLLDDTLRLNVAVFRMNFDDLQVSSRTDGLVFTVGNAASAISQGVEAELRWKASSRFEIGATAAYLDAYYDDYGTAPCFQGQTAAQGCIGGAQNLTNRELQSVPRWKASLSGEYERPLSGAWGLRAFVQANYIDRFSMTPTLDPRGFQKAYTKIDARLALASTNGFEISVLGKNLTDEKTANFGNASLNASFFVFGDPPREVSVQARYSF